MTFAVSAGATPYRPPAEGDGSGEVVEDRVAAAVLAVPGVAELHGGTFGEAATYLPGRRVNGIRVNEDGVDVHVTLLYGIPIQDVAERIRRAVSAVTDGPVQVTIEDLVPPGGDESDLGPS